MLCLQGWDLHSIQRSTKLPDSEFPILTRTFHQPNTLQLMPQHGSGCGEDWHFPHRTAHDPFSQHHSEGVCAVLSLLGISGKTLDNLKWVFHPTPIPSKEQPGEIDLLLCSARNPFLILNVKSGSIQVPCSHGVFPPKGKDAQKQA